MLEHDRRSVLHFNVTSNPTAEWTAQQIVEAFPWERSAKYLLRDNDKIYGETFQKRFQNMGLEEVPTAPRSPWQNAHMERFMRSLKSECLNRMIFFGEKSVRRAVHEFLEHYHSERNHQGRGNRLIEPSEEVGCVDGKVECHERLGGLLHYYYRDAA